jgi:hypothetical protein
MKLVKDDPDWWKQDKIKHKWWVKKPDELGPFQGLRGDVAWLLIREGYKNAQMVREAKPEDILLIYNLGKVKFEAIKQWLRELDESE